MHQVQEWGEIVSVTKYGNYGYQIVLREIQRPRKEGNLTVTYYRRKIKRFQKRKNKFW